MNKVYDILTSRKFYSSVAAIVMVMFGFEISEELQLALMTIVGSGYVISTGIQSGLDKYNKGEVNLRDKLVSVLQSRKFYGLIAIILAAFNIEVSPEFAASAVTVATAMFGLGTALETGLRTR